MSFTVRFDGFEGIVSHSVAAGCGENLQLAVDMLVEEFDKNHRLHGYGRTIEIRDEKYKLIGEIKKLTQRKYGWVKVWFSVRIDGSRTECETVRQIEKILEKIA